LVVFAMSFGSIDSAVAAAKKDPEARFKKLDKNSDSKLSLEEFVGKKTGEKKEKAEKAFKKRDKDGDGSLTLEEFKGKKKKK
jgi:Ca2+-binding EF-hand superfamily protein